MRCHETRVSLCFPISTTASGDPRTPHRMPEQASAHTTSTPETNALSETAIGAVVALVRVAELYDSAVAHRSALRAVVAERLYLEYTNAHDRRGSNKLFDPAVAVACAALADCDLVVSRPNDPEACNDPDRTTLAASLTGGIVGLEEVSFALEHQCEHWDGGGTPGERAGVKIPLAARIAAVADALVGNPTAGFIPSWHHARRRVQRQSGNRLDPSLCESLARLDLGDVEAAKEPSLAIAELLHIDRNTAAQQVQAELERPVGTTDSATTIRNAVAVAGRKPDLMTMFAATALETVQAAEVLVLRSSATQLEPMPIAHADDGGDHLPPRARLNFLFEFSTQAELRAGETVTRDTSGAADKIDEIAAPIIVDGNPWGALVATRRHACEGFSSDDVSQLQHVATEMADAVTSSSHWAEMERMALRDQLTGLGNRHELYRVLDAIFERPPGERVDSALIMCDVDGLKVINDTLGHQTGDRLLVDAAAALKGAARDPKHTTICRIGGDEFCMVIERGALLTAHEISDTIERLFARSAGSGPARSISCGIAFPDETVNSRSALLRAADENQYETKRARKAKQADHIEGLLAIGPGSKSETGDRRALRD